MMTVADIQRFSLHDGPGIRSTVFLKGCLLRCAWCHNPETLDPRPEEMRYADGRRVRVGTDMTLKELMADLLQDLPFYRRSGGGVTLSGGEPLVQARACEELLRALKNENIHTAVQTCLACPWDSAERLLPWVDLWIVDVKHTDTEKHRRGTGKGNTEILENVRRLNASGAEMLVRTPVIPDWNDSEEEIRALAEWVRDLPRKSAFELLPFHPLGTDKYRALGRPYPMEGTPVMSNERFKTLEQTAQAVMEARTCL